MSTTIPINVLDVVEALRDLDDAARQARLDELKLSPKQRAQVQKCLRAMPRAEKFLDAPPTLVRDAWSSASAQHHPLLGKPGEPFGEYRLILHLASGAFGEVWTASHRSLDAPSAIPVCLKLLYPDRSDLDDVLREARTMASIRHENVVSVHRADRADLDGRPIAFIEMELVGEVATQGEFEPAQSLARAALMDRQPRFLPSQAMAIVADICRGVHAAHLRGILHRDLKPANILIALPSLHVKVTDFGIASHTLDAITSQSQRGLGTPAFMAPEQAGGEATQASDIYALGAVLHFLLSGEAPYGKTGESARAEWREILDQLQRGDPPRPLPIRERRLPPPLLAIVAKAMRRDPTHRYASAAAMADDLDACRSHRPTVAERPGALRRLALWCRRNPAVAVLLAFIAVTAVLGPVIYFNDLRQEQARTESQRQAAVQAQQLAVKHEQEAVQQRLLADRRVAEGLVLQADALASAGRWLDARRVYNDAAAALTSLQMSTFPVDSGVWAADRASLAPLLEFQEITWPPLALAVSPDGKLFASGGGDNIITLRDALTGAVVRELKKHTRAVRALAFSSDGALLASAGDDRTVCVWSLQKEAPPQVFSTENISSNCIAFSRDNSLVAAGGYDNKLRAWDVGSGELKWIESFKHAVHGICFFPDGSRFAVASEKVIVYDLASRARIKELPGGAGILAISRNGDHLLTEGEAHTLQVWDTSGWRELKTLPGHARHQLSGAAFLGGRSDRAVTCSWDRTFRVWDLAAGQELRSVQAHEGWLLEVAATPDGRRIITSGYDRTAPLRVWDLESDPPHYPSEVRSISADWRCLLVQPLNESLRMVDVATGKDLAVFESSRHAAYGAQFADGVSRVISSNGDGKSVRCWDALTCKPVASTSSRRWMMLSPNDRCELAEEDGRLVLRDHVSGKTLWRQDPGLLEYAVFSADSSTIASWHTSGSEVTIWNAATGAKKVFFQRQDRMMRHAALTPDGSGAIVTRGGDRIDRISCNDGTVQQTYSTHGTPIVYLTVDPKGVWLAGIGEEAFARLWDLSTGREIRSFATGGWPTSAQVSADGQRLLISSREPTLCDFGKAARERAVRQHLGSARATLAKSTNDPSALAVIGRWYASRQADDWAVILMEKARSAGADVSSLELAQCYWRLGRKSDAAREFERARDRREAPDDYLSLCIKATR